MKSLKVSLCIIGGDQESAKNLGFLSETLKNTKKVFTWNCQESKVDLEKELKMKHFKIEILSRLSKHPPIEKLNKNSMSIVLKVSYLNFSVVITGDANFWAINQIFIENFPDFSVLECDVFLMCHHGSSSSQSNQMIYFFKPRVVLVSCGKRSYHGHVHPSNFCLKLKYLGSRLEDLTIDLGKFFLKKSNIKYQELIKEGEH